MDTQTATDAAAVAAGMAQIPAPLAIFLDGFVVLLAFAFKVFLLWITVKTVSRGTAALTVKALVYTTLGMAAAYFVANPMLQTDELLTPLVVLILVGTLVYKRVFWISIDRAFFASLIVCPISIFVGDYSRRGLDAMYPMRATINMSSASALDTYAMSRSGNTNLPPSMGTLPALVRLTVTTNTSGPIGSTLAFLRAGLEAKEYVERIRRQAEMEARISNLLGGGGTNQANRAQEMAAMKAFFGSDTNKPGGPNPHLQISNTYTGRGYAAAYAHAKAQIEEINRIASNNAALVNFLSGAGTNVSTRAEEMAKLEKALMEEAQRQGIDLSGTNSLDMAIVSQAMANAVSGPGAAPGAEAALLESLAANMYAQQPTGTETDVSAATNAAAPDEAWKVAATDLVAPAADGTVTGASQAAATAVLPGLLPASIATSATGSTPSVELLWTGCATAPGGVDLGAIMLTLLASIELQPEPAATAPEAKSSRLSTYAAMAPEERARWIAAQNEIKVSGVVHTKSEVSAFVGGKLVRNGDAHDVKYEGSNYTFRLRGTNKKGQCIWEPVVTTNTAAEITVGF